MASKAASKIGRGVVVRGTIRGEGDVTIEGRVEGSLEVSGDVELAESARVRAPLSADRIVVRGAVAGDLRGTESIVLEAGAQVVGDLGAPSIGIRPGGLLRGYVSTSGRSAPAARGREGAKASRNAPVATPAPRAQRPATLQRGRDEAAVTAPAGSQRSPALPKAPARAPAASPPSQKAGFVEPIASPMTRPTGKPAPIARESSSGPPPPVVPALKKGARGSMKKKAGR